MPSIDVTNTGVKPKTDQRLAAARAFAVQAAKLAADDKCTHVVVLDVRGLSPVTDYFVLATGTSARQMRTVIDDICELGEQHAYSPLSTDGYNGESWILLDCVDVLIHVFSEQARSFYDLDGLWGDAPRVDWSSECQKQGAATS